MRAQALAAVTDTLHAAGVRNPRLTVLSDRGSLLVRVHGPDVVARVSTHTARQRRSPEAWLARELQVAAAAAERDLPVVRPATTLDPGPHLSQGLWLSFWQRIEVDGAPPTPMEAADLLVAFHEGLQELAGTLPVLSPVRAGITEGLDYLAAHGGLTGPTLARLRAEHGQAVAITEAGGAGRQASGHVVLHGDAHEGNIVRSGGRLLWLDLEETSAGPPGWDLAVLAGGRTAQGSPGVQHYCRRRGLPLPSPTELAAWQRLRTLQATVWLLGCAVTFPQRYREPAAARLAQLIEERPPVL